MRYPITFAAYGHHLHGATGTVDRTHNHPGSPFRPANPNLAAYENQQRTNPPYLLDSPTRIAVLKSLQTVCTHRNYNLLAAHVRTNHVHVIVESDSRPKNS